ncbi:MAG: GDSL family lipase [Clostridia bacterium]|nr:GDSL family lipase [Clostridia bacterium]
MKILFQGDSITDSGRNREDFYDLGLGYPKYVAEMLREVFADTEFEFINRGIGGHKTCDLVNRWEEDAVAHNPDIITILVGINDTWHCIHDKNWIPAETYEANYRKLLSDIKEKTDAKIIILEQFLVPMEGTEAFHGDLEEKINLTRKVACEFADRYVPLNGLFATACVMEGVDKWTVEGVHPTEEGHRLIADYCFDAICDIIEEDVGEDE